MSKSKGLKILQFTTYPIERPDHGGKIRSFEIRRSLRRRHRVETLAIYLGNKEQISKFNVELSTKFFNGLGHSYEGDIGINDYLRARPKIKLACFKIVEKFNPDIVVVEQIFLWPLISEMKSFGLLDKAVIVNSTHNHEAALKKSIYETIFSKKQTVQKVARISQVETSIIHASDINLAVSVQDRTFIKKQRPAGPIYVFPNGHYFPENNALAGKWRKRFSDFSRNFVFVGSWHPPNIEGLYRLLRNSGKMLKHEDIGIWIIGMAGEGLRAIHKFPSTKDEKSHIHILGAANAKDIDAAVSEADGVLLPIWSGGGTNLKTAQALLSGKTILATKSAFRGFESFEKSPGIYISDTPTELVNLMARAPIKKHWARKGIRDLTWEQILRPLPQLIQNTWQQKKKRMRVRTGLK